MKIFKIINLEVYPQDLPKKMDWYDAINQCELLGSGWRLPTKNELNYLYKLHKFGIGNFIHTTYWSSTEKENKEEFESWYQLFQFGEQYTNTKAFPLYVRPVRDINII